MSKEISTTSDKKQQSDDYFKAKQETIRQAIKGKGYTSKKVAKYIPEGYYGRIAVGEDNIDYYLSVGFTFAVNDTGERVTVPNPSPSYLMIISLEEKAIIDSIKAEERKKYHNQTAIDGLKNIIDPSSATPVFREI